MMKFRFLLLASYLLILVVSDVPLSAASPINASPPAAISVCLPSSDAPFTLAATVGDQDKRYYLVDATPPKRDPYWSVIERDSSGCAVLETSFDFKPLRDAVPVQVAQQLALGNLRRLVDQAGGVQQFQQQLEQHYASQEPGTANWLDPDDLWAYQQLGIRVDWNYNVITSTSNPSAGMGRDLRSVHP